MSLRNLTLVIPTYKRPRFILRAIKFWQDTDVTIIVMDGSPESIDKDLIADFGKNIYYYHEPIPFLERLQKAMSLVNTPYVSLIPDDEFFMPSTIIKCIEFLEKDSSYIACGGMSIAFRNKEDRTQFNIVYPKLQGYKIDQETGIERMQYHMHEYTPSLLYSIMRKDIWKQCMSLMTHRIVDVYAMLEIEFEMAASFHGKSIILPELLWLRSMENVPVRNEAGMYEKNTFYKWWEDDHKKAEHETIINDILHNFNGVNISQEKKIIGIKKTFDIISVFQKKYYDKTMTQLNLKFPKLIGMLTYLKKSIYDKTKYYTENEVLVLGKKYCFSYDKTELSFITNIINEFHRTKLK